MRDFKILTKLTREEANKQIDNGIEEADFDLYNEQEQELIYNCLNDGFMASILALQDGKVYYYDTIDKAIEELLTMKEGADLVEFDNGNIGFVGYNGLETTCFEILRQANEIDRDIFDDFEFYPTIEEYNEAIKGLQLPID